MSKQIPGGWTDFRPATKEDQDICNLVKHDVEAELNRKFHTYTAIKVQTQVVAGVNYTIEILVDHGDYLLTRIFKFLDGDVKLVSVHYLLKKDDAVENVHE